MAGEYIQGSGGIWDTERRHAGHHTSRREVPETGERAS
jgi:hypothetical protein